MGFPACQLGVQFKGLLSRGQPVDYAVWICHSLSWEDAFLLCVNIIPKKSLKAMKGKDTLFDFDIRHKKQINTGLKSDYFSQVAKLQVPRVDEE